MKLNHKTIQEAVANHQSARVFRIRRGTRVLRINQERTRWHRRLERTSQGRLRVKGGVERRYIFMCEAEGGDGFDFTIEAPDKAEAWRLFAGMVIQLSAKYGIDITEVKVKARKEK